LFLERDRLVLFSLGDGKGEGGKIEQTIRDRGDQSKRIDKGDGRPGPQAAKIDASVVAITTVCGSEGRSSELRELTQQDAT